MGNLTDKYCIVGIGQTAFMTNSGRSTLSLVCEAMKKAMDEKKACQGRPVYSSVASTAGVWVAPSLY